jgi:hypothetical protein
MRSDSTNRIDRLPSDPAIVIATGGCEPIVDAGYSAAIILDAQGFLSRPDLRAGEEAVRLWLRVVSQPHHLIQSRVLSWNNLSANHRPRQPFDLTSFCTRHCFMAFLTVSP